MNKRPNVLFIITDDQGYGDLSCLGATDLRTPHLDALAARGTLLTSFYSNSPVCSPARAALLTGRYPGRAGVRSILAGHRQATGLPAGMPTAGSCFQAAGYRTFFTGKWHLGLAPESRPDAHGFDHWCGFLAGCVDYYSHIFYWGINHGQPGNDPTHDLWEDGREIWRNGDYLTDFITKKTLTYLDESIAADEPFFGYVAYNAPHYPMHAPAEYLDRFPDLPPERRIMAAMVAAMDDGVGAIVERLREHDQLDNTCIVFLSDNGPSRETRNWLDGSESPYYGSSSGGLRGHKFSLFEGGIRVPGIISWPAGIAPGQNQNEPVAAFDLLPTVLTAAGEPLPDGMDGMNLLPWLRGQTTMPERNIFWEQGDQTALRRGRWKLVLRGRVVEQAEPVAETFLSDLDQDFGETTNLAAQEVELATEMRQTAERWRAELEEYWRRCKTGGLTGNH